MCYQSLLFLYGNTVVLFSVLQVLLFLYGNTVVFCVTGLVEHVISVFTEVSAVCLQSDTDMKTPAAMLMSLLDTLHAVLKHVSDVVRKALQVRLKQGSIKRSNKCFAASSGHLQLWPCG